VTGSPHRAGRLHRRTPAGYPIRRRSHVPGRNEPVKLKPFRAAIGELPEQAPRAGILRVNSGICARGNIPRRIPKQRLSNVWPVTSGGQAFARPPQGRGRSTAIVVWLLCLPKPRAPGA
jgi:hypothetical protein